MKRILGVIAIGVVLVVIGRLVGLKKVSAAVKAKTHLSVDISATTIPVNGLADLSATLTDDNGRPMANQKIVFAYDSGWNWAEYVMTDAAGKAKYVLRTNNNVNTTGFCGRRGSQRVAARYQAEVYFQGSVDYESSMARIELQLVDPGEAAANPRTVTEEAKENPKKVPPVIYYGWDYNNNNPASKNYGPFGGIYYQTWNRLDFGSLNNYINQAKNMKIRLADGTEIAKPVIHGFYLYDGTGDLSSQRAKDAAGGSYILTPPNPNGNCPPLAMAKVCDSRWQNVYREEVYSLGREFDGKLAAELISIGFEGELVDAKNLNGCDYKKELHQTIGCSENSFYDFVKKAMGWYREAFPNTPLFVQGFPFDAGLAMSFNPPIGFKTNNWESGWGIWTYSNISDNYGESRLWYNYPKLPRALESKYAAGFTNGLADAGKGNYWGTYWMLLAMLAHKPDFVDFHSDHWDLLAKTPWLVEFVNAQLQKKPENSPMVWTAMRDTHESMKKDNTYNNCQQSGVYGDYSFYIYRREGVPGSKTVLLKAADLPVETKDQIYTNKSGVHLSRADIPSQVYTARRTDQANGQNFMAFDIDNGWKFAGLRPDGVRKYKIILTYIDKGSDSLAVEYYDGNGQVKKIMINKGGTNKWIRKVSEVSDVFFNDQFEGSIDIRINNNGDGDETIHMLEVWGEGGIDDPTVTQTPAATPTRTSPSPTGIGSSPTGVRPSPTGVSPTVTPRSSPSPTGTGPSPTGTGPSPTGIIPTATSTIANPSPTGSIQPSPTGGEVGCSRCPSNFECYQATGEYRWFVPGYVMLGFSKVGPEECSNRGIAIPAYKDKIRGDANCDGYIDGADYSIWRKENIDGEKTKGKWEADFTGVDSICDGGVNQLDFERWRANLGI